MNTLGVEVVTCGVALGLIELLGVVFRFGSTNFWGVDVAAIVVCGAWLLITIGLDFVIEDVDWPAKGVSVLLKALDSLSRLPSFGSLSTE